MEITRQSLELEIRSMIASGLEEFGVDVTVPPPGDARPEDAADADDDDDLTIWKVAVISGGIVEYLVNSVLPMDYLDDEEAEAA